MARAPQRTCVGCRATGPRGELVRLALVDGELVVDREARLPGRGAWVHPREACVAEALRRRAFERAFRRPVAAPAEKLDLVSE